MKNKKIQKSYMDYGFGLPVQIINAPLKKIRGEWILDILTLKNMNELFFWRWP